MPDPAPLSSVCDVPLAALISLWPHLLAALTYVQEECFVRI
jgi:hypothetical protein